MAIVNVNSNKTREIGDDILKLSGEISGIIGNIFTLMEGMPNKTGEWRGKSANYFVSKIKNDKIQYTSFINSLRATGNYLKNYADSIDESVRGL